MILSIQSYVLDEDGGESLRGDKGPSSGDVGFISLSRADLARLKSKAVRRGAWFTVLSRIEQSLVDATIKTLREVRSVSLANSVTHIVEKLSNAMKSVVARLTETVGFPMAHELSRIAQGWGNKLAAGWIDDAGFIRYLAITYLNAPS